jgi:hypothetical protein
MQIDSYDSEVDYDPILPHPFFQTSKLHLAHELLQEINRQFAVMIEATHGRRKELA